MKINPERNARHRQLAQQFGVRALPNIIFLDFKGRKLYQHSGYRPAAELRKVLDEVLSKGDK